MDTKNISGDQRAAADEIKVPELISRYASDIAGQLRCWDRVVITGTLVEVCHAKALKGKLDEKGIRCFDIGQYAEPLREQVRKHAAELASCAGVEIQHLDRKSIRKEDLVAQKLRQRQSSEAGLICVFSAMENCTAFKPLARQVHRDHRIASDPRQVPSLLLLLSARSIRADLRAGAHLAALSFANLFQWPQLAGP
jgi:hypothetical protein